MNGTMKENRLAEERMRHRIAQERRKQMQEQKNNKHVYDRLEDAQKKLQEAEEEYRSARSDFEKQYPSRPVPLPYPVPVPYAPTHIYPWRIIPGVDRYPNVIFSSNNSE